MSVRSVVRSPVDSPVRSVFAGSQFNPILLFGTGAQGAWYDPSDFSTLFQNSAGTTPVTAVEQPVGLMLDRSRGLVLGPELVTNGGFDSDTAWTKGAGWTISGGQAVATAILNDGAQRLIQSIATVSGRAYVVTYTISGHSGAGFSLYAAAVNPPAAVGVFAAANGTYTEIFTAPASTTFIGFGARGGSAATFNLDNVSVRELPGTHAVQATSASRPVLRARYNLLTYSEELNNAIWTKAGGVTITANAIAAPTGATTADYAVETATTNSHQFNQSYTYTATAHTWSAFVKPNGRQWCRLMIYDGTSFKSCWFDVLNGIIGTPDAGVTATLTALSDGWYRPSITYTCAAGAGGAYFHGATSNGGNDTYSGDITKGYYVWGAQLLTAADQTSTGGAYQRIAAATDYDVSNPVWRPYLAFDGVDDFFNLASAISITTDMTVVRGFGRAAGTNSVGLGNAADDIREVFQWAGDNSYYGGFGSVQWYTGASSATTGYRVQSHRRSASAETVRSNGTQIATRTPVSITGLSVSLLGKSLSYSNQGPIYGLIVLNRELTGSELTATEQWMANKTGATLA